MPQSIIANEIPDFAGRKPDVFAAPCPSREILKHISSRWGMLILLSLQDGKHRFSELHRRIGGISEKMLAQTLQVLADDGLVQRTAYPVVPPYVEYALTPLGEGAAERVESLIHWIESNLREILESKANEHR